MLLLLALLAHHIAIKISPLIMMQGSKLTVTCIVDRMPENRWLDVWLQDEDQIIVTRSQRQLEGDKADKNWPFVFDQVECGTVLAVCVVSDSQHGLESATAKVNIANCDAYHELRKGRRKRSQN